MPSLIDSSLWIDFTRAGSPRELKEFIAAFILAPQAVLAEPIAFEVLRHARPQESRMIEAQFQTLPMLETPASLWKSAAVLGQACRKSGVNAGSVDLLIASVAIHNDAELITFDKDFERIAKLSSLNVKLLQRPAGQ